VIADVERIIPTPPAALYACHTRHHDDTTITTDKNATHETIEGRASRSRPGAATTFVVLFVGLVVSVVVSL
jgi:fatty acid desaturase